MHFVLNCSEYSAPLIGVSPLGYPGTHSLTDYPFKIVFMLVTILGNLERSESNKLASKRIYSLVAKALLSFRLQSKSWLNLPFICSSNINCAFYPVLDLIQSRFLSFFPYLVHAFVDFVPPTLCFHSAIWRFFPSRFSQ